MSVRRLLVPGLVLVAVALAIGVWVLDLLPAPLLAPRVVSIEPKNDATEILPTTPITITFSTAMDRTATENAVAVVPGIPGSFSWRDDQTLVLVPTARLPISTTLTLDISTDARSWIGRPLASANHSQFTTLTRPAILSGVPALDAQFVYTPDRVRVEFNREMQPGMLGDSLRVDPQPQNFSFDLRGRTLTLYGYFEPGVHYQVTISAGAIDAEYGIPLERDYTWSFTATAQYPHFSILQRDRVLKVPANTALEIPIQYANISQLATALYPIDKAEFETLAAAPFETWYSYPPTGQPRATSTILTHARLDKYVQSTVPLSPLAAGTYYLKITTPEGPGDRLLLLAQ